MVPSCIYPPKLSQNLIAFPLEPHKWYLIWHKIIKITSFQFNGSTHTCVLQQTRAGLLPDGFGNHREMLKAPSWPVDPAYAKCCLADPIFLSKVWFQGSIPRLFWCKSR